MQLLATSEYLNTALKYWYYFLKINFEDDFKELPRRPKNINEDNINKFPKLYQTKKKITLDKWNDLQSLKSIMPYDCHSFYDGLPHMETSIRK